MIDVIEDIRNDLKRVRKICDRCFYISKEHEVLHPWANGGDISVDDYMRPRNK